jgi:hypothetical protein
MKKRKTPDEKWKPLFPVTYYKWHESVRQYLNDPLMLLDPEDHCMQPHRATWERVVAGTDVPPLWLKFVLDPPMGAYAERLVSGLADFPYKAVHDMLRASGVKLFVLQRLYGLCRTEEDKRDRLNAFVHVWVLMHQNVCKRCYDFNHHCAHPRSLNPLPLLPVWMGFPDKSKAPPHLFDQRGRPRALMRVDAT